MSSEPSFLDPPSLQDSPIRDAILRFVEVSKNYSSQGAQVQALQNLSLDIVSGSFVALMGRSGCGKSTLLNLAGAMDLPSNGQVLLDGVATAHLDDKTLTQLRREKVGFVFQSFQLLQTLSVVENVELPLLLGAGGHARERALAQLEHVGLADYAARMPHQLSGGQMQRVAIARALVHQPTILLADEPTGNLDTSTGSAILELLGSLRAKYKTTIVMATHSEEAVAFADTVVRLRDGRIESLVRS